MKKFLLSLALLILVALPAYAEFDPCAPEVEKYKPIAERYQKGLLFKVKKCGVEVNYIFGTMHSDDEEILNNAADAFYAMKNSRNANFEIKFGPEVDKVVMKFMYFDPNSIETLQSKLDSLSYESLKRAMQKTHPEITELAYFRMRPWAAAVIMQEPPVTKDGIALDMRMQSFAERNNIPVYGIETAEEQMDIFSVIPESMQVSFLKETIDNIDQILIDSKTLQDLYLKQDLTGLKKMADESIAKIKDRDFAEIMQDKLIDDRNKIMVDRMKARLAEGGAFIAVGSLHLPGEKGMLKLLEGAGYYIEVVPDSATNMVQ